MSFQVKIEIFEGPFDLLLQLILRQELDIHEVPIAQITSSYLEHLEDLEELDLESTTEFLVIAATLLLIKARSLLPSTEQEPDLTEDSENARDYLIDRLVEFKQFQNASEWLAGLYAEHGWYLPTLRELEMDYSYLYPDPFEGVRIDDLGRVLMDLFVDRARDQVDTSYIAPIKVSVAQHIDRISSALKEREKTSFSKLAESCESTMDVIAAFLAVLELYKRGRLSMSQRRPFGDIIIKRREGERSSAA